MEYDGDGDGQMGSMSGWQETQIQSTVLCHYPCAVNPTQVELRQWQQQWQSMCCIANNTTSADKKM
jgi:hypothetical protein